MARRKKKYEVYSFEDLAHVIHQYLMEDGLALNLSGFRDILQRYFRLQDNHLADVHEVMIDCNLWYNYFSEIEAFIQLKKEEWTLEADWLFAHEVFAEPSESLENKIQSAKERALHYGLFQKHVESQRKFFWKASDHCQKLYKRGVQAMARS